MTAGFVYLWQILNAAQLSRTTCSSRSCSALFTEKRNHDSCCVFAVDVFAFCTGNKFTQLDPHVQCGALRTCHISKLLEMQGECLLDPAHKPLITQTRLHTAVLAVCRGSYSSATLWLPWRYTTTASGAIEHITKDSSRDCRQGSGTLTKSLLYLMAGSQYSECVPSCLLRGKQTRLARGLAGCGAAPHCCSSLESRGGPRVAFCRVRSSSAPKQCVVACP